MQSPDSPSRVGAAADVSVKLQYGHTLRRVVLARAETPGAEPQPLTWSSLEQAIRTQCSISSSKRALVMYNDQDGDPVQVDTDEEIVELVDNLKNGNLKKLKLYVRTEDIVHVDDFVMIPSPVPSESDSLSQPESISDSESEAETSDLLETSEKTEEQEENQESSNDFKEESLVKEEEKNAEEDAAGACASTTVTSAVENDVASVESSSSSEPEKKDEVQYPAVHDNNEGSVPRKQENQYEQEPPELPPRSELEEFIDEVQPLIDQLLTKLESRPEFIPKLMERFNSSLNSRNWGISVEPPPVYSSPSVGSSSSNVVQWDGVRCDGCNTAAFVGTRHKCLDCADYDLCDSCFAKFGTSNQTFKHPKDHQFESLNSHTEVWRGVGCDGCGRVSFSGLRYKCQNCPDFDFCEKCHKERTHHSGHVFLCLDGQARERRFLRRQLCRRANRESRENRESCEVPGNLQEFCKALNAGPEARTWRQCSRTGRGRCHNGPAFFQTAVPLREGHHHPHGPHGAQHHGHQHGGPHVRSHHGAHHHGGPHHWGPGMNHFSFMPPPPPPPCVPPPQFPNFPQFHGYCAPPDPIVIPSRTCSRPSMQNQDETRESTAAAATTAAPTSTNSSASSETATGTSPRFTSMPGSFPESSNSKRSSYAEAAKRASTEPETTHSQSQPQQAQTQPQQRTRPVYGIDVETGYTPYVNIGDVDDEDLREGQEQLKRMGFKNAEINADLLRNYNGEVDKVLDKLLEMEGAGL